MTHFLTLDDLNARGKVVLLRADLNVPVQNGAVTDATRLERLGPTIRTLSSAGAKTVILSHFGRPRGNDAALSLAPIALALGNAIGKKITFVPDCVGELPRLAVEKMSDGDIILLENVRFYPEEEKNDPHFAQEIARIGDVYVNDAFSCAHRAHATTAGLAQILPAYAGRLMEEELTALQRVVGNPERPVVAVVGGAKVSTKISLLNNLVAKIDVLILGGGMANTFLSALDNPVGKSLCEHDMKDQARTIIATAAKAGCDIVLPIDAVVAEEFRKNPPVRMIGVGNIRDDEMMLDIGDDTVSLIRKKISGAKTVLWNGPMGAFETEPFEKGTVKVAQEIARLTQEGKITSIAGGGDTVSALALAGVEDKMSYVSTAGGAFLEWLEGQELPGVKALETSAKQAKAKTA